jgi:hypothetical protein
MERKKCGFGWNSVAQNLPGACKTLDSIYGTKKKIRKKNI